MIIVVPLCKTGIFCVMCIMYFSYLSSYNLLLKSISRTNLLKPLFTMSLLRTRESITLHRINLKSSYREKYYMFTNIVKKCTAIGNLGHKLLRYEI